MRQQPLDFYLGGADQHAHGRPKAKICYAHQQELTGPASDHESRKGSISQHQGQHPLANLTNVMPDARAHAGNHDALKESEICPKSQGLVLKGQP